jgi:hypothetical protein
MSPPIAVKSSVDLEKERRRRLEERPADDVEPVPAPDAGHFGQQAEIFVDVFEGSADAKAGALYV